MLLGDAAAAHRWATNGISRRIDGAEPDEASGHEGLTHQQRPGQRVISHSTIFGWNGEAVLGKALAARGDHVAAAQASNRTARLPASSTSNSRTTDNHNSRPARLSSGGGGGR